MTRSLLQQSFNQDDLANEWEEAYLNKAKHKTNSQFSHFNAIFSDDDDEEDQPKQSLLPSRWLSLDTPAATTGYIDPVLSSSTYHIHQADNALTTLKHVVLEDGWKKALKHKSGVIVHMKNGIHKGDKTPIFKGEAIIQGFSPQAIFYVIGMRKLWDELYEDGNLVENLNDTTSLTYEAMKPTATSKSRDLALVEKIECTQNGAIVFACTSVETPRIPRMSGKTRVNTKLQGWILEPLHGGPNPATKVVFVVQESMKGWVPGFAKKTLARRPLVIAKVAEYLEKKTERIRQQQQQVKNNSGLLQSVHSGHSRRPSVMSQQQQQHQQSTPRHYNNSPLLQHQQSILINQSPVKKHISFADHDITYTNIIEDGSNSTIIESDTSNATKLIKQPHLYPSHRHPIQKVESIQLLKKLSFSTDNWILTKEFNDGSKYYVQQSNNNKYIRIDGIIDGQWTAEQICSVIHCFGSRKIWDKNLFKEGKTIERFSQKEYLVQWILPSNIDLSGITSLESDSISGTIYTATTSVIDQQLPPDELNKYIRLNTELYGWIFKPIFDRQGRTMLVNVTFIYNVNILQQQLILEKQSILQQIKLYLTQYGCPPYIRRIAGKVIKEEFNPIKNQYQIVFIVKHQPSNSYKARKSSQLWCTDIRFQKSMFPFGLDVHLSENTHVDISIKDQKSIKIFTTDQIMEGRQLTFTLMPLTHNENNNINNDFVYRYNGNLFIQEQKDAVPVTPTTATAPDTINTNDNSTAIITNPAAILNQDASEEQEPIPTITVARIPSPADPIPSVHELTNESSDKLEQPAAPTTIHIKKPEIVTEEKAIVEEEALPLEVPKGYLLIPEHQNNNIIMITDELSFNGQQISVIFLAMVVCYYMGKFTSCSSC